MPQHEPAPPRERAIHKRGYRFTDSEVARIERLATAWGGIKPLSENDVIREALRRADVAIRPAKKSTRGLPDSA